MNLDKVKATNFYQDNADKTKLNWFLYEFSNFFYTKIFSSSKLARYRKLYSQEQITEFCVYFSKRLRKSIYNMQLIHSKDIVFDKGYIYEFYSDNLFSETLLNAAMETWNEQVKCCSFCPNNCLVNGYEITNMFDNLEETGWPT